MIRSSGSQSTHRLRYEVIDSLVTPRRAPIRVLLQQTGYRPGTAGAARPAGGLSGICRDLTDAERETRRRETGRPPALRLRTDVIVYTVSDVLHGRYTGIVDDFVVRRGDGVPAYNLAVVVDDAAQGIDQVVRGDDLLTSSPRQAYLAALLDTRARLRARSVGAQRRRRAAGQTRRRGDTRRDRGEAGVRANHRVAGLARSDMDELLARSTRRACRGEPWTYLVVP